MGVEQHWEDRRVRSTEEIVSGHREDHYALEERRVMHELRRLMQDGQEGRRDPEQVLLEEHVPRWV